MFYYASRVAFKLPFSEMTSKLLVKDSDNELLRLLSHWTNLPGLAHASHLEPVYVPSQIYDHVISLSDVEARVPARRR